MPIQASESKKSNKKEDLRQYLEILKIILSYSASSKKVDMHFMEFNKWQNLSVNTISPLCLQKPHIVCEITEKYFTI